MKALHATCRGQHDAGLFSASLIQQPWCEPSHLPATRCLCGTFYYSWKVGGWFRCDSHKPVAPPQHPLRKHDDE